MGTVLGRSSVQQVHRDAGASGLAPTLERGSEAICREMEARLRLGEFEAAVLLGIERVDALLRRYFPGNGDNPNELPDAPSVL